MLWRDLWQSSGREQAWFLFHNIKSGRSMNSDSEQRDGHGLSSVNVQMQTIFLPLSLIGRGQNPQKPTLVFATDRATLPRVLMAAWLQTLHLKLHSGRIIPTLVLNGKYGCFGAVSDSLFVSVRCCWREARPKWGVGRRKKEGQAYELWRISLYLISFRGILDQCSILFGSCCH
jgi:hypothetical protein